MSLVPQHPKVKNNVVDTISSITPIHQARIRRLPATLMPIEASS
ncbi:hypothetical protein SynSYN20_00284 [Synechococcus sp. SYN20]|nr:hypothetical protein SynSYN20_00284 [Synechococcus sp. SYN20]